jgi:quaternary ammonium compound-resistance protein SugE
MVVSLALLGIALRTIPVGTGYAVWTGIGAAGTAIVGIIVFAEPATVLRLGCIALILAGVVGLKFASPQ